MLQLVSRKVEAKPLRISEGSRLANHVRGDELD
jgi:hypothetical protein